MNFIVSDDGTISLYFDSTLYHIRADHPHYNNIIAAIREENEDKLRKLCMSDCDKVNQAFDKYTNKAIGIGNEKLYFDGSRLIFEKGKHKYPLNTTLSNRFMFLVDNDLDLMSFFLFISRLFKNPSFDIVRAHQDDNLNGLFNFLSYHGLPITLDGWFIAYKAVRSDMYDKYTGTILNKIGKAVSVPRHTVDPNPNVACSHGLHVGTPDYVRSYASGDDKQLVVMVDPADVVAVPYDYEYQKMRVCRYVPIEVIDLDNECCSDGVYFGEKGNNPWDLVEGESCLIVYEGEDDPKPRVRFCKVHEIHDDHVIVELEYPEPEAGEFRKFKYDNIYRVTE